MLVMAFSFTGIFVGEKMLLFWLYSFVGFLVEKMFYCWVFHCVLTQFLAGNRLLLFLIIAFCWLLGWIMDFTALITLVYWPLG